MLIALFVSDVLIIPYIFWYFHSFHILGSPSDLSDARKPSCYASRSCTARYSVAQALGIVLVAHSACSSAALSYA